MIKKLRKSLDLNTAEMARACNVHRQTYVKWERGEREPSAATRRLLETLVWLKDKSLLGEYLENFNEGE